MEEKKVTVDGVAHKLPDPFMVIATENEFGYVGTYPLPEAQLDRFLIKLSVGYPTAEDEAMILYRRKTATLSKPLSLYAVPMILHVAFLL